MPKGAGFVRCPHCAKATSISKPSKAVEVTCGSCDTHYAIPLAKFTDSKLVVTCKKCGNRFEVKKPSATAAKSAPQPDLDLEEDELPDSALAEDMEMDLGELDADSWDLEEEEPTEPGGIEADDEDFAQSDLIDEVDLPEDEDEDGPGDFGDLSGEDLITDEEKGLFLGDGPTPQKGQAASKSKKGKTGEAKSGSGKGRFLLVALLLLVLLAGAGGWWLMENPDFMAETTLAKFPVQFQPKQEVLVSIQEPLKGKWVKNSQVGAIFVLSGTLKNFYPPEAQLAQVQISGRLYDKDGKVIAAASNLAGRSLKPERIGEWNRPKLEAYSAFLPNDPGPTLDPSQPIPFQILFLDVKEGIQKLEAEITGLVKDGQPIQVR
ncbi:MAG: hypothetical protein A2600_11445 [Candidatus Lambdaproteobacteria bacterium RIFOXYD1_FULL_56_27]|uniref:Zinc finger/thioredoxin putative domain-containing protein n=1 Tax=Candidatus Lambdaproteobacteria bacterium RIFOXYD2_FULL_56_26 TaxID=1817773 RepID=A0A1F6H0R5_9PROT|nr:MAG: hypothetical protein A2426_12555 [Candidatus Lambdaproteobacteria bacterium RIFOXYC1_FULL_56_13]OGH03985.1 MAG: hypothetical protein A2557_11205 [Candidatus Lambdaproteobacteria bacterium RIFOXYD2_FULL_56_26]OGH08376.1 MAG: hypothetical protein A2600_11445 [Candidatus Lambdaproteobacteria bacterium RIFOXYD1_FULL_56_27]